MNNLATIQRIKNIRPIPGADAIEVGDVLGWSVVIKKNEYKDGDMVVFHQPDTIVDANNPHYSFLKDKRLRTIKLRGQVSQGLVLPIDVFDWKSAGFTDGVREGDDVTSAVRIEKYEKLIPAELAGKAKGALPSFLRKTDELNLRSYPDAINDFNGRNAYISTKLDGTSVSFYVKDGELGVCSRNLDLLETDGNAIWKEARDLNMYEKLKICDNVCLQG